MGAEMSNASNIMTIAEFERLLEVYGSDRTRWPAEARAGAGHLAARDPAARRRLAEAEALDRVLERAPLPTLVQEAAIAERIVAAARRTPRIVSVIREGIARPAAAASNVIVVRPSRSRSGRFATRTALGGAAGALAASLVFGVLLGLSNLSQGVVPALEQMTGLTFVSSGPVLAQVDLLDEDLL